MDEQLNRGDITKVIPNDLDDIDVFVYSPPCQSFSVAGKQEGVKDPRGQLFYDALPIIQIKQPKYALMENVRGLTGKKFEELFADMLNELDLAGYNNYWQILNTKDYGIPQNRERVFIISIRKDIDDSNFEFPKPFDSGLRLKDFLEDVVDEKYYISDGKTENLFKQLDEKDIDSEDVDTSNNCLCVGRIDINGHDYIKRVYSPNGTSPTIPTVCGGNHEPKILEDFYANRDIRVYDEYCPTLRADRQGLKVVSGCSTRTRSYMGQPEQLEIRKDNISNSITTVQKDSMITDYRRVRKLTPKECFRLQGFSDEDYAKARIALETTYYNGRDRSNSRMYKMAGNSITVDVIEEIYKILFREWLAY